MNRPNQPGPNQVVLDHSGHFVADADAARAALDRLGFTVTPLSAQVQPDTDTGEMKLTGTGNICVMLPAGYLEVLVHTADTPIGREFKAALDRRAGLHLAAFGLHDTAARHAQLVTAGLDMRPLVHFSRDVETDSGVETAAFTVARLAAGIMPEGRVQSLTHHNVPALWQPRWTTHANGAQSLNAIVLSAPDPAESAARFSRFLGRPVQDHGPGLHIVLDRGTLEFLPEGVATDLVGHAVDPGRPCFVGLRIGIADLAALPADPAARWVEGSLVLPFDPALGSGVWLFHAA
ncbi:VOC family protein [Chachezhania sediminis]|uniref:VOC family protein n=1 Tax=Chachezhania sediminis TaxID=2599291 RepID=UPI00131D7293|nr:VOC family protein [Chachezhania sediminis]